LTLFGKKTFGYFAGILKITNAMIKKNLILTLSLFMFYLPNYAQTATKEKELSNAETFSAQSGTLIQKEVVEIFR
jgi:hypothetical protein